MEHLFFQNTLETSFIVYFEKFYDILLVKCSHHWLLIFHKLENINKEEKFEYSCIYSVPSWKSFLNRMNQLAWKWYNFGVIRLYISWFILFPKYFGLFLHIQLQKVKTQLIVNLNLQIVSSLIVDLYISFVHNFIVNSVKFDSICV